MISESDISLMISRKIGISANQVKEARIPTLPPPIAGGLVVDYSSLILSRLINSFVLIYGYTASYSYIYWISNFVRPLCRRPMLAIQTRAQSESSLSARRAKRRGLTLTPLMRTTCIPALEKGWIRDFRKVGLRAFDFISYFDIKMIRVYPYISTILISHSNFHIYYTN